MFKFLKKQKDQKILYHIIQITKIQALEKILSGAQG
jgi:hypothetical protein